VRFASALLIAACLAGASPPGPARAQSLGQLAKLPTLGDTFPPFDTQAIDGTARRVDYPKGTTTVLLFFLSSCPTCHTMIPEWNRAYERRQKGVNIVGVILDKEHPGFFSATKVAFPVVRSPGAEFMRANKVNNVPLTLRIAPGGKIEDLGMGIVDPIRLGQLFSP
jgi:hypothetical protein